MTQITPATEALLELMDNASLGELHVPQARALVKMELRDYADRPRPLDEQQLLQATRDLLAQGADPNAYVETRHDFRCVLGLAMRPGFPSVVQALLDAGAVPHWPGPEPTNAALAGAEDVAYSGLPLDPLTFCLENIAWRWIDAANSQEWQAAWPGLMANVRLLLARGADPLAEDPALGRRPFDHLGIILAEHAAFDDLEPQMAAAMAQCILDVAIGLGPQEVAALAARDWEAVSFLSLGLGVHASIGLPLKTLVDAHLLSQAIAPAPVRPAARM